MARPTNEQRIVRLILNVGEFCRDCPNIQGQRGKDRILSGWCRKLDMISMCNVLGAGCDSTLLALIREGALTVQYEGHSSCPEVHLPDRSAFFVTGTATDRFEPEELRVMDDLSLGPDGKPLGR